MLDVMRDTWRAAMVRDHQPGEAVFRSILPEDIDWKPFPAFPPSARLAVLVGEPTQAGPYVIRVKVPSGVKLMPHRHPEDRIYTVMSGVFYIGLGDRFDGDKVKAYPPGSVIVLPGDTVALPLGKVRRVCHSGNGHWSAGPRIH
jgi:quercetin dioxygenase-like cupin family protein